jgi:enoyl-CoA hydratase
VAPDPDFPALVDTIVRRLTRGAPLAQAATKKAVNAATLDQLPGAFQRERAGQSVLLRTDDAVEGMRAFNEKRRPEFLGR